MAPGTRPAPAAAVPSRRRELRTSLLLAVACLLIYNANLRLIGAADTYGARYLPFGILRHGSLLFDLILGFAGEGRATPPWLLTNPAGHAVSMYPVVLPVLATPLYLPAFVYLQTRGWDVPRVQQAARIMEKITASFAAAACAALMYLLLRRRADRGRRSLLLTPAFAFGTTHLGDQQPGLGGQHGLAEPADGRRPAAAHRTVHRRARARRRRSCACW